MASTAVMPQANGMQAEKPMQIAEMITEMAQFDKIIKLRDEVLAGTHPRVKLNPAPNGTADAPSNISQANPLLTGRLPNGSSDNGHKQGTVLPSASEKPPSQARPVAANIAPATASTPSRPFQPAFGSSGINPIFLTKSDDLIRAETKLQRKRIEDKIKEQLQQYKKSEKQREMAQEMNADFVLSDVLEKATGLLKQMGVPDIAAAKVSSSPAADSADENTFYSSQVNDSPVNELDERTKALATKPCKFYFKGKCGRGNACPNSHDPAFKKNLQTAKPLTQSADTPNADTEKRTPQEQQQQQQRRDSAADGVQLRGSPDYNGTREPGEIDESSYSPPHTQQEDRRPRQDQNPRGNNEKDFGRQDNNQNAGRYPKRRRGKYSPEDGQIVRNHITSPVAPQPARVSPLAVAKVPRVENLRHAEFPEKSPRDVRQDRSGPQSPITPQVPASRKRRRDQDFNDSARNVAPRRDAESPIPYIKDEPMSPPPFMGVPANRYPEQAPIRSPMIEQIDSPRVVYQPARPAREYVDDTEIRRIATTPSRRVVSGPGAMYESQREPELRRIVSARQPIRLISPQPELAYYSAKSDRPVSRAISHAHAPPYGDDDIRAYRTSVQPQPITYARSERVRSPEVQPMRYSPIERGPRQMAPPARRVVVDQQGNRYYAAPAPPERHGSVLMEPRYADELSDPIPRRASVRPEAARLYSDGNYVQRISPEPPSPRYVEYRQAPVVRAVSRAPQYEAYEEGYRPRSEAVRIVEYPSQRVVERYEEALAPAPRMHSLAPSYPHAYADEQYEVRPPRGMSYRAATTQPGAEVSTATSPRYVQDRREIIELGQQPARHVSVRLDERDRDRDRERERERERVAPFRHEYLEPAPAPQQQPPLSLKPRYQYMPMAPSQTHADVEYDMRDMRDGRGVMVEPSRSGERRAMPRL